MSKLKTLFGASVVAAVCSSAIISSALAQGSPSTPASGTWTPAQCNGASATIFPNGNGNGFGGGDNVALLLNDASGKAGVQLMLDYGSNDESANSDFRSISITFKGANNSASITNVHFCFITCNGTGCVVSLDKKLSDLTITSGSDGYSVATANSSNFPNNDVQNWSLAKVTIAIPNKDAKGAMIVGDTQVTFKAGTVDPTGIASNTSNCSILGNCNNVTTGVWLK